MLEQVQLFSGLEVADLEAIEGMAVRKHYRRNTVIIEYGDEANTLFLIETGRVKVYRLGEDNKEVIFREIGPGSYFGELALLVGGTRCASVQTLEDSDFLVLTRHSFERIIVGHPQIARILLRDLARRVYQLSDDLGNLALLDVYGRVVKLIENSAVEEGGQLITGKLTQQDIASRVGSSREMVSKILKDLRVGGYVDVDKKRIVLLKRLPTHW